MRYKILFFFIGLFFYTLSPFAQTITYEGETDDLLMLSVAEFNVKKKDVVEQAIKDAYFHLLFRGIPESVNYKQALLGTDENVMEQHRQYYDNMLHNGRIYSFVPSYALTYYRNYRNHRNLTRKEAIVYLSINVQALISDLERNNLYRRFGLY